MRRPQLNCTALFGVPYLLIGIGCGLEQPSQEQRIGNLGSFEFRLPSERMKGIIIGAPHGITEPRSASYAKFISQGTGAGLIIASGFASKRIPVTQPLTIVRLTDYGRIESVPSKKGQSGIVIGAPHGTFDEHTAEVVGEVSYRTGLAAVIARGFTPTECAGWRINVNRPTERLYPSDSLEIRSERAQDIYQIFKQSVLEASRGNLNLYIDIHQNGRQRNIEVATVGISEAEAQIIKKTYREIRDRVLKSAREVQSVDLLIEPIDNIEIGAWATKAQGILGLAQKSLHFEFPLYSTLEPSKARESYTDIVALLLDHTTPLLNTK